MAEQGAFQAPQWTESTAWQEVARSHGVALTLDALDWIHDQGFQRHRQDLLYLIADANLEGPLAYRRGQLQHPGDLPIAFVTAAEPIRMILAAVGLAADSPRPYPARTVAEGFEDDAAA